MKKIYYLLFFLFPAIPSLKAQTVQSKQEIKNHFQNGYAPGAIHFGFLIDACYNYSVGEGLLYESTNNSLKAEVPLNLLQTSLTDTARILRQERTNELNKIKNALLNNESDLRGEIHDLESRMRTELSETSVNIRSEVDNSLDRLNTSHQSELNILANEMNQNQEEIRQSVSDSTEHLRLHLEEENHRLSNNIENLRKDVDESLEQFNQLKTDELADTAKTIRFDMQNQFRSTNDYINTEVEHINTRINDNHSGFIDSTTHLREDFELKLLQLEAALKDSTQVLRRHITDINNALILKIESGEEELSEYIENTKADLIKKIDSLAEAHNIGRTNHENRMSGIEQNHSTLSDTVYKMKQKLDTLNYTEKNFTNTMKEKLENIQDGATRSDNNFTDELQSKLEGIENNANNYQLYPGTHSELGGIKLSSDFLLNNGKVYSALDPNKIDRQFASDTSANNWTSEIKDGDEWTRVRYKTESGVDAEGNKLYDYGEWNQPYKFIYDDLESLFYTFNATDSVNVILGIHEKDKKFTGKDNTLLGHNAGYTLYKGGERNVAVGKFAGRNSGNISDNVLLGNQAGESIGDPGLIPLINGEYAGERNVALGSKAMQGRNATGKTVAIGYSAMELGEQNSTIAIGYKAANHNSGTNNLLIGYEAGLSIPGSNTSNNIAIGYRSAYKSAYTKRNIFIGDSSAFENESGKNNIFIGHGSGKTNKGSGNLIIGNNIDVSGNNQFTLGNHNNILISGDFASKEVSIDKLLTKELNVSTSISETYSVSGKEVINNSAAFVGEGGVNTSGQITSSFANTKLSATRAISAPNGSVFAKYLSADQSILLGNTEVVNSASEFVGSGGVKTRGNIQTDSSLRASHIQAKTGEFTESLQIAGFNIVSANGNTITERYSLQNHQHNITDINTNTNNRFVSDTEKARWNNKVDKLTGKALSSNDFTHTYKSKLDAIAVGANRYVHPASHPAGIITQDASRRFVSDTEKARWNNKVDKLTGKALSSNDFTHTYKSKLDGIETRANRYIHPASHPARIITQDASHRFVSDTEKTRWNNKVDKLSGKALSSNDFTHTEKRKLADIEAEANNYVHPNHHSADMIRTTTTKQFVSQRDKNRWDGGQIPIGGIIMWNGTTVPRGWALCNGETVNGKTTPDLRGRFILGSYPGRTGFNSGRYGGTVTNAGKTSLSGDHDHTGNTGGYKLTLNDLPRHSHGMAHTHRIPAKKGARYSRTNDESLPGGKRSGNRRTMQDIRDYNFSTESSSKSRTDSEGKDNATINSHRHTISDDGEHDHTLPFYILAFIMRVE